MIITFCFLVPNDLPLTLCLTSGLAEASIYPYHPESGV